MLRFPYYAHFIRYAKFKFQHFEEISIKVFSAEQVFFRLYLKKKGFYKNNNSLGETILQSLVF